jgi:hypothetical protein
MIDEHNTLHRMPFLATPLNMDKNMKSELLLWARMESYDGADQYG